MTSAGAIRILGGGQTARRCIGDRIERLLALLDAIDGDPDLELDDDFGADDEGEALTWRDVA